MIWCRVTFRDTQLQHRSSVRCFPWATEGQKLLSNSLHCEQQWQLKAKTVNSVNLNMCSARVPLSNYWSPTQPLGDGLYYTVSWRPLVKTRLLIQSTSSDPLPGSGVPAGFRLRVSDLDYYLVVVWALQMNQLWPPAIIVLSPSVESAAGQAAQTSVTDKHTGKTN